MFSCLKNIKKRKKKKGDLSPTKAKRQRAMQACLPRPKTNHSFPPFWFAKPALCSLYLYCEIQKVIVDQQQNSYRLHRGHFLFLSSYGSGMCLQVEALSPQRR